MSSEADYAFLGFIQADMAVPEIYLEFLRAAKNHVEWHRPACIPGTWPMHSNTSRGAVMMQALTGNG
jgi:hypothetical protein